MPTLSICSDAFPYNWDGHNHWQAGLRGWPNCAQIVPTPELQPVVFDSLAFRMNDMLQDGYRYESDIVFSFPRPIARDEKPFVTLWIWLPPFEDWPYGYNSGTTKIYFGFRFTLTDQFDGLFWSGLYIGRHTITNEPYFFYRVSAGATAIKAISQPGWWSLAMTWDDRGALQLFAALGRVEVTALNKMAEQNVSYDGRFMKNAKGHFLQLLCPVDQPGIMTPNFVLDRLSVKADVPAPKLTLTNDRQIASLQITEGYPEQPYTLQKSSNLIDWTTVTTLPLESTYQTPILGNNFFKLIY